MGGPGVQQLWGTGLGVSEYPRHWDWASQPPPPQACRPGGPEASGWGDQEFCCSGAWVWGSQPPQTCRPGGPEAPGCTAGVPLGGCVGSLPHPLWLPGHGEETVKQRATGSGRFPVGRIRARAWGGREGNPSLLPGAAPHLGGREVSAGTGLAAGAEREANRAASVLSAGSGGGHHVPAATAQPGGRSGCGTEDGLGGQPLPGRAEGLRGQER